MNRAMEASDDSIGTDAQIPVLAIVEKYEAFVNYLYPILQSSPRRHGVIRDIVLAALFSPIGDLYQAAKSRQVSRLYAVDADFATLRSHLRFLVQPSIRVITPRQHGVALATLSEPGRMLGAWIRKLKSSDAGNRGSPRPMGQVGK